MVFGENHKHFHALIAARGTDVPADRRSGNILKLVTERADRAAATDLVPAVRDAYLRYATSTHPDRAPAQGDSVVPRPGPASARRTAGCGHGLAIQHDNPQR